MKKVLASLLAAALTVALFTGCSSKNDKTIVIGASPTPHAEILKVAAEVLKDKGYTLEIKEFTDYVQPNLALDSKELDANYFQHKPYLDDFNAEHGTKLVSAGAIHYEPLGLYPGKTKALADLKNGATIAVPNDSTNEGRALLLLQDAGLITLKDSTNLKSTAKDIAQNPKNLKITEVEAAQLPRSLQDVDLAVINGNYAIQAGLNAADDALAKEEKDSLAATTYANIIAVRSGDENKPKTKALLDALKSDKVTQYIENQYKGAVIAID